MIPSQSKEEIHLPWIQCLWCDYKDKIEFDMSLHFLEKHKEMLLGLPITSKDRKITKALSGDFFARFESAIEFRLDVAVEMAKKENRDKGVKHAIRQIQRRALERRRQREKDSIIKIASIAELNRTSWRLIDE